jgi:hypothetical protein
MFINNTKKINLYLHIDIIINNNNNDKINLNETTEKIFEKTTERPLRHSKFLIKIYYIIILYSIML